MHARSEPWVKCCNDCVSRNGVHGSILSRAGPQVKHIDSTALFLAGGSWAIINAMFPFSYWAKKRRAKELGRLQVIVDRINAFEVSYQKLSDSGLGELTQQLQARFQKGETLEQLLPEAFAAVKNGARRLVGRSFQVSGDARVWDMIPYDVQLMGGIVLHENTIAEMQTGEGKTLVAVLPLYLNALTGKNVQLATVNEYLAQRDAEWMRPLYKLLGMDVGCVVSASSMEERKAAYAQPVTYSTASELGFDYLRDQGLVATA